MFDFVQCEYPLPLGDHAKELETVPDWSTFEFQTKDFSSLLNNYVISEDGQIYLEDISCQLSPDREGAWHPFEKLPGNGGIEKLNYTGEFVFFGLVMGKKNDVWIEFKVLFWKGDLKEISLEEWNKEDNAERIAMKKSFDAALKKYKKKSKRHWYKINVVYTQLMRSIFSCARWLLGSLINITWKLERWTT